MTAKSVRLFDATTIDTLPWPDTEDGEYAKHFLTPLIKNGVKHYVDNIETQVVALTVDDLVLPVTLNDAEYEGNSYICSPYDYFISYGRSAVESLTIPWLRRPVQTAIIGLGKLLKKGHINKVVSVNNWPFSTNLYPQMTQEQIAAIRKFLQERFPRHAILFRCINTFEGPDLYRALKKNRFHLIATRQVYFISPDDDDVFKSRMIKSDCKALRETQHAVVPHEEIAPEDADRIISLYRAVFVDRHSALNPQLNANLIKLALESRVLQLFGLKKNGQLDAVVGYFYRKGVLMSPLLGYDTSQPKEAKLYRLASIVLTLKARDQEMLYHLSSGADFYKKIRRAKPNIEYMAVCAEHLSAFRRFPWLMLKMIMNSIGKPLMKLYGK